MALIFKQKLCRNLGLNGLTQLRRITFPSYKGPFDPKKDPFYRYSGRPSNATIDAQFAQINAIRNKVIESPSPFHLIWRYKFMRGALWSEKVILRRLGIHDKMNGIETAQIVPNSFHFNRLIWDVKHLIRLKPVSFPDGVPQDTDIGATRINIGNGEMNINETFRISPQRLSDARKQQIFEGKYLREYLKYNSWVLKMNVIGPIEHQ